MISIGLVKIYSIHMIYTMHIVLQNQFHNFVGKLLIRFSTFHFWSVMLRCFQIVHDKHTP